MSIADLIQNADERRVLLPIDMFQLDGHVVNLLQCPRAEKIRRVVVGFQHPLVFSRHHGGQLCQVAYHEQLYAAKWLVVVAETSQHGVNGIEQVGTYH